MRTKLCLELTHDQLRTLKQGLEHSRGSTELSQSQFEANQYLGYCRTSNQKTKNRYYYFKFKLAEGPGVARGKKNFEKKKISKKVIGFPFPFTTFIPLYHTFASI